MKLNRRQWLETTAVGALAAMAMPFPLFSARAKTPATRPIPSTGEALPLVGLGSWITFNVGNDQQLRDESAAVIKAFLEAGGRLIDSSPMYGSSQATIGYGLKQLGYPKSLFSAEKVWISNANAGPRQIEKTRKFWGVPRFDLLQVHNLRAWEPHLERLFAMKADGQLRYVGVTTSHGRRHGDLEHVLKTQPIDFVQLTYNVADRDVEARLLPLARERGIAVIVNRPFRRGALIHRLSRHKLPPRVSETGAISWAQFLLKFVISHPAVSCAIPATTRVDHVRENLSAASDILPDQAMRERMVQYIRQL